ncbi:MAG: MerR family transcriptional regulator [Ignavibacteriae bacterium]|nr:MerR family transcriptional regulator [Ignavibacteriota bacterium]
MEKLYSITEAADLIGVNKETLRRWDKTGKFKSSRHPINNYRVYSIEKINTLVKDLQIDFKVNRIIEPLSKPFFETSLGKLYNLDVLDFFKSIDDNSVDLIFADPPYNIKKAEWDTFQSQKQYVDWSMDWINEAHRVLKPSGTLFVCGFSEILADIKWAASHLFQGCKWLVWFYRNKANLGNDWGRSHESILHFRKSKNYTFNIDEIRIPYNEHTLKYPVHPQAETSQYNNGNGKEYIWEPHPKGAKPKDVLEIPTLSNGSWEKTIHSTQKPIELVKKIILSSSKESEFVIDPFGGSGTTYAVAEAFNRRWSGTELDVDFCSVIKERVGSKSIIKRIASNKDEEDAIKRRKKLRSK